MKNNPNLKNLQDSFACILYGIIQCDGVITDKERKKFDNFFSSEFELSQDDINILFSNASQDKEYDKHISLLKEAFSNEPMKLMQFMQYLNGTILSDGVGDGEYALFEKVRDGLL